MNDYYPDLSNYLPKGYHYTRTSANNADNSSNLSNHEKAPSTSHNNHSEPVSIGLTSYLSSTVSGVASLALQGLVYVATPGYDPENEHEARLQLLSRTVKEPKAEEEIHRIITKISTHLTSILINKTKGGIIESAVKSNEELIRMGIEQTFLESICKFSQATRKNINEKDGLSLSESSFLEIKEALTNSIHFNTEKNCEQFFSQFFTNFFDEFFNQKFKNKILLIESEKDSFLRKEKLNGFFYELSEHAFFTIFPNGASDIQIPRFLKWLIDSIGLQLILAGIATTLFDAYQRMYSCKDISPPPNAKKFAEQISNLIIQYSLIQISAENLNIEIENHLENKSLGTPALIAEYPIVYGALRNFLNPQNNKHISENLAIEAIKTYIRRIIEHVSSHVAIRFTGAKNAESAPGVSKKSLSECHQWLSLMLLDIIYYFPGELQEIYHLKSPIKDRSLLLLKKLLLVSGYKEDFSDFPVPSDFLKETIERITDQIANYLPIAFEILSMHHTLIEEKHDHYLFFEKKLGVDGKDFIFQSCKKASDICVKTIVTHVHKYQSNKEALKREIENLVLSLNIGIEFDEEIYDWLTKEIQAVLKDPEAMNRTFVIEWLVESFLLKKIRAVLESNSPVEFLERILQTLEKRNPEQFVDAIIPIFEISINDLPLGEFRTKVWASIKKSLIYSIKDYLPIAHEIADMNKKLIEEKEKNSEILKRSGYLENFLFLLCQKTLNACKKTFFNKCSSDPKHVKSFLKKLIKSLDIGLKFDQKVYDWLTKEVQDFMIHPATDKRITTLEKFLEAFLLKRICAAIERSGSLQEVVNLVLEEIQSTLLEQPMDNEEKMQKFKSLEQVIAKKAKIYKQTQKTNQIVSKITAILSLSEGDLPVGKFKAKIWISLKHTLADSIKGYLPIVKEILETKKILIAKKETHIKFLNDLGRPGYFILQLCQKTLDASVKTIIDKYRSDPKQIEDIIRKLVKSLGIGLDFDQNTYHWLMQEAQSILDHSETKNRITMLKELIEAFLLKKICTNLDNKDHPKKILESVLPLLEIENPAQFVDEITQIFHISENDLPLGEFKTKAWTSLMQSLADSVKDYLPIVKEILETKKTLTAEKETHIKFLKDLGRPGYFILQLCQKILDASVKTIMDKYCSDPKQIEDIIRKLVKSLGIGLDFDQNTYHWLMQEAQSILDHSETKKQITMLKELIEAFLLKKICTNLDNKDHPKKILESVLPLLEIENPAQFVDEITQIFHISENDLPLGEFKTKAWTSLIQSLADSIKDYLLIANEVLNTKKMLMAKKRENLDFLHSHGSTGNFIIQLLTVYDFKSIFENYTSYPLQIETFLRKVNLLDKGLKFDESIYPWLAREIHGGLKHSETKKQIAILGEVVEAFLLEIARVSIQKSSWYAGKEEIINTVKELEKTNLSIDPKKIWTYSEMERQQFENQKLHQLADKIAEILPFSEQDLPVGTLKERVWNSLKDDYIKNYVGKLITFIQSINKGKDLLLEEQYAEHIKNKCGEVAAIFVPRGLSKLESMIGVPLPKQSNFIEEITPLLQSLLIYASGNILTNAPQLKSVGGDVQLFKKIASKLLWRISSYITKPQDPSIPPGPEQYKEISENLLRLIWKEGAKDLPTGSTEERRDLWTFLVDNLQSILMTSLNTFTDPKERNVYLINLLRNKQAEWQRISESEMEKCSIEDLEVSKIFLKKEIKNTVSVFVETHFGFMITIATILSYLFFPIIYFFKKAANNEIIDSIVSWINKKEHHQFILDLINDCVEMLQKDYPDKDIDPKIVDDLFIYSTEKVVDRGIYKLVSGSALEGITKRVAPEISDFVAKRLFDQVDNIKIGTIAEQLIEQLKKQENKEIPAAR